MTSDPDFRADAPDDDDATDALDLLTDYHDELRELFEDYESLIDQDAPEHDRQEAAAEICAALELHAQLEDEILYPAAREALDDPRLVDEASIEHATARSLMGEIEAMSAADALFDARVTVLGRHVMLHMDEEEEALLPQLADAGLDLDELGRQLALRRQELEDLRDEGGVQGDLIAPQDRAVRRR
jgi:hypothetical protein